MTEQQLQAHLPSATAEIEPCAAAAVDLQHPLREFRVRVRLSMLQGVWWNRSFVVVLQLLQLYLTLCDPIDGSPPGTAIPGILQARTLEWVAMSFSKA